MTTRIEYIDTLRVLACFLVILTHSTRPVTDCSLGAWLGIISLLGAPSPDLFISISGAVLLPVKTTMKEFYFRRFKKLLPPVAFWSVVVLSIYFLEGQITGEQLLSSLVLMPCKPVIGVYWFVYVIAGLYLLAPIISAWLKECSRKSLEFVLALWLINMFVPYLNLLPPPYNCLSVNDSHCWMLNYFSGFLGYWLLGYYLRTYPVKVGWNKRWVAIGGGCVLYILSLILLRFSHYGLPPYMANLQLGCALLVALIYTLIQSFPIKINFLRSVVRELAKYSFGIYLLHLVVVRELVWRFFQSSSMHPFPETFLIAIISLTITYAVIKLIGLLPFSKWLIGV